MSAWSEPISAIRPRRLQNETTGRARHTRRPRTNGRLFLRNDCASQRQSHKSPQPTAKKHLTTRRTIQRAVRTAKQWEAMRHGLPHFWAVQSEKRRLSRLLRTSETAPHHAGGHPRTGGRASAKQDAPAIAPPMRDGRSPPPAATADATPAITFHRTGGAAARCAAHQSTTQPAHPPIVAPAAKP